MGQHWCTIPDSQSPSDYWFAFRLSVVLSFGQAKLTISIRQQPAIVHPYQQPMHVLRPQLVRHRIFRIPVPKLLRCTIYGPLPGCKPQSPKFIEFHIKLGFFNIKYSTDRLRLILFNSIIRVCIAHFTSIGRPCTTPSYAHPLLFYISFHSRHLYLTCLYRACYLYWTWLCHTL